LSDHFDGRRFFNPTGPVPRSFRDVPRMLRERRTPWPKSVDVPLRQPPARGDAAVVVTFIGHSTFLIQTPAGNILTDPMYSERAGPFNIVGPKRVRRPAIPLEGLPRIATVLLSHNHYDHCDLRTLRFLAERFDPIVVTPLGNGPLVRSAGVRRVEELDWWQSARTVPEPTSVTPAHHFSARTPFDRNRALWGGFMLTVGTKRIFFAGDTAYSPLFGDIHARCGAVDLALLPIGAYEPRWFMSSVHMNPAEAVQAHLDLHARRSIATHFGTFRLTMEGIDDPLRALAEARTARGVNVSDFEALEFGASFRLE